MFRICLFPASRAIACDFPWTEKPVIASRKTRRSLTSLNGRMSSLISFSVCGFSKRTIAIVSCVGLGIGG
ncbi:hypothetical protein [Neobacillus vireti]|uniref:hypothetical protein n=1 Tax=Neobacillus vireti TaxID=220686 RepID=UPI002E25C9E0